MYKSYSMNNMPQQIKPHSAPETPPLPPLKKPDIKQKEVQKSTSSLKSDDLILILVIFMLLFNDCDDKLLLMALAYVFFADYFG